MLNSMRQRHQRGMSIVELMVGIAVGMFIVAAATLLTASQLSDNKQLLLETQLQQDLRSSLDIVIRDLRRSGSRAKIADTSQVLWQPDSPNQPIEALYIAVSPGSGGTGSQVDFFSARDNGAADQPYGFRHNTSNFTIEALLPNGAGWQELTDKKTMKVEAFTVTAQNEPSIPLVCPRLCADGTQDCWPTIKVRSFVVTITARSQYDAAVVRTVRGAVRIRSDEVEMNDVSMCPVP